MDSEHQNGPEVGKTQDSETRNGLEVGKTQDFWDRNGPRIGPTWKNPVFSMKNAPKIRNPRIFPRKMLLAGPRGPASGQEGRRALRAGGVAEWNALRRAGEPQGAGVPSGGPACIQGRRAKRACRPKGGRFTRRTGVFPQEGRRVPLRAGVFPSGGAASVSRLSRRAFPQGAGERSFDSGVLRVAQGKPKESLRTKAKERRVRGPTRRPS